MLIFFDLRIFLRIQDLYNFFDNPIVDEHIFNS
jgi:hypothetical protein